MRFFTEDKLSALEAKEEAQRIAFAPMIFQASRVLRNTGILAAVENAGKAGITLEQVKTVTKLPHYGARVLLEAGLGIGLVLEKEGKYFLTKTGFFILHDKLTTVNLDFNHDVCYKGLFDLDKSIANEKPEGLKEFGSWKTVYEALAHLPADVQKSWFAFDHYYSDVAFPEVLGKVFRHAPQTLLDIGGNTGKWAIECCKYNKDVQVTIMDLPGQTNMAEKNIANLGFADRVKFYKTNILDESLPFPKGYDAIWMSQFLDCFSDKEIVSILKRCYNALNEGGKVYILEPFWDRQRFEASAFCLQMTSLYFTTIANGNSQMYNSTIFISLVEEAGFTVQEETDNLGVSHTLLACVKK
ncbi:MAG: methyltransferase [Bacteroidia bacterium]